MSHKVLKSVTTVDDSDEDAYFMRPKLPRAATADDMIGDGAHEDLYGHVESSSDSNAAEDEQAAAALAAATAAKRAAKKSKQRAIQMPMNVDSSESDEANGDFERATKLKKDVKPDRRRLSPPPKISRDKIRETARTLDEWAIAQNLVPISRDDADDENDQDLKPSSSQLALDDDQMQIVAEILARRGLKRTQEQVNGSSAKTITLTIRMRLPVGLQSKPQRIQDMYTAPFKITLDSNDTFDSVFDQVLNKKGLLSTDLFLVSHNQRLLRSATPQRMGMTDNVEVEGMNAEGYEQWTQTRRKHNEEALQKMMSMTQQAAATQVEPKVDDNEVMRLVFRHKEYGKEPFAISVSDTLSEVLLKYLKKHQIDQQEIDKYAILFDGEALDLSQTVKKAADGELEEETILDIVMK